MVTKTKRRAALSPSRVKEFDQCPLKFRLRNIDQVEEPPSKEALRGTIVHSVLEHLYDVPANKRSVEYAQGTLEEMWLKHKVKNPKDADIFDDEQHVEQWLESARPLIDAYFDMENPQYLEPAGREEFVNAILPSGLAIRGIIDRIDTAKDGRVRVVDYKTGKSPHPSFQEDALFQMRFYASALFWQKEVFPSRLQLIYLKNKKILTYDPVKTDIDLTEKKLNDTWIAIKKRMDEGFFEAKTSQLCNWCGLKQYCPDQGGESLDISEEGIKYMNTAAENFKP